MTQIATIEEKSLTVEEKSVTLPVTSIKEQYELAELFIKSKAIPPSYNTPEKVIVGIQRAKELKMPPLAGLANLPMISGIPSPSVHLLVSKAREAGIRFTLVKDAEKIFEPVLDANGEQIFEDGKPKMKIDLITTIRTSEYAYGRWFDNEISYRWSEAIKAGLIEKDNWKKMPIIMLRSRALAMAARFAAPEATLGLMSAEEMSDIHNVPYTPQDFTV
jgi:hypothetical protein